MSTRLPTIVVFLLLSLAWLSNIAAREWSDPTGKYRVDAELIDFTDGVVRLRKEDGQVVAVPLEKLSLADQRFVRQKSVRTGPPEQNPPKAAGANPLKNKVPSQQSDRDRIQGLWRVDSVQVEADGRRYAFGNFEANDMPFGEIVQLPMVCFRVFGDRVEPCSWETTERPVGRIVLDETKVPRQIDLTVDAATKGRGVYELEGNVFTVCLSTRPDSRPDDTRAGDGRLLAAFKRIPPDCDEAKLHGSCWRVTALQLELGGRRYAIGDGQANARSWAPLLASYRTFRFGVCLFAWDDSLGLAIGGILPDSADKIVYAVRLDSRENPKQWEGLTGEEGHVLRGTYELDGDRLKLEVKLSLGMTPKPDQALTMLFSLERMPEEAGQEVNSLKALAAKNAWAAAEWIVENRKKRAAAGEAKRKESAERERRAERAFDAIKQKLWKDGTAGIQDDLRKFYKEFSDTKAAIRSREDPDIMGARELSIAIQLLRVGNRDAAIERLKPIVTRHPETKAAAEAKQLLENAK